MLRKGIFTMELELLFILLEYDKRTCSNECINEIAVFINVGGLMLNVH